MPTVQYAYSATENNGQITQEVDTYGSGTTTTSYQYDVANRVTSVLPVSGGASYYAYGADNKRIFSSLPNGNGGNYSLYTLYGLGGEKIGDFMVQCNAANTCSWRSYITALKIWFAGRLVTEQTGIVGFAQQDRMGTNRSGGARYRPYGDEITSTGNDHVKYATYTRDAVSGLDYADKRFYASTYGRFVTADPYSASAKGANDPGDPGTWNRYA